MLEHREKQYDVRLRVNVHVREGGAERVAPAANHCGLLCLTAFVPHCC